MRNFDSAAFDRQFAALANDNRWQEEPGYYPRYRSRYETILRRYAQHAPPHPIDVLDIGGGQLAFLASRLWGDRACLGDIDTSSFARLGSQGIDAFQWDLARDEPPVDRSFDAIFFSEVIEHLPVPGHVVLGRLRKLLRPGGLLLCSTPNLYRWRNIVYLIRGQELFDHFELAGQGGLGHVLEYSADHLAWQFGRAGFDDYTVELRDFKHVPRARGDRLLSALGAPLRRIPRYRDNLLAVAKAP
jgi:SAM-dependent methyltransferase